MDKLIEEACRRIDIKKMYCTDSNILMELRKMSDREIINILKKD
jgi:hypothetical protein